jgi:hypothetical protein
MSNLLDYYNKSGYNRYYSHNHGVMCRSGYAMFAAANNNRGLERGSMFGDTLALYDGTGATDINDLIDIISQVWDEYRQDAINYGDIDLLQYEDINGQTISALCNPSDIVDSAGAYDDESLTAWLWQYILEPRDIYAIITNDGAIIFDESLITHMGIAI